MMKNAYRLWIIYLPAVLLACKRDVALYEAGQTPYTLSIPRGFPEPDIPQDNPLTTEKVALGKKLFFDPVLSKDHTISCATCHQPEKAFTDGLTLSQGFEGREGLRNAPSLTNIAYATSFFRDGGVPTLEMQILAPFDNEDEFHMPMNEALDRLNADPEYAAKFQEVFGIAPDGFGLTRAIAAYERTLISGNAPYDRYTQHGEEEALSQSAKRGMALFNSDRLQCSGCHSGFNFTNNAFEHNGIFRQGDTDPGRERLTLQPQDRGKFKVPTLRNVALTAPYMHDGRLATLDEVIDHYAAGGSGQFNQSEKIKGFSLTESEREDLIAFLQALTDEGFINQSVVR